MKTRAIFGRAFVVAGLFLGGAITSSSGAAASASDQRPDAASPAKTGITKGMSAVEVRRIIGNPATIRLLDSAEVKAEHWTYKRKLRSVTTQEPVRTEAQPAFIGLGMGDANGLGTIQVSIYRLKHTTHYQMTALLMVDDRVVEARQWVETVVTYEG